MFESLNFKKLSGDEGMEIAHPEEDVDTLTPRIEEIHLDNLDVSDLRKIQEAFILLEEISNCKNDVVNMFQEKVSEFLDDVAVAYTNDELRRTAMVHLLRGTEIPSTVEHLDLEGEYSIEAFIKETSKELSETD